MLYALAYNVQVTQNTSENPTALLRQLGIVSAIALVVSNMVGTGIFTTSGFLAGRLGAPKLVLIIWVVGAVFALVRRVLLFGAGGQFSEFRRRIRLSDARLRSHLGLHVRLGLVLRRIFGAHRGGGAGVFRLPGLLLPHAEAGQRAGYDRLRSFR